MRMVELVTDGVDILDLNPIRVSLLQQHAPQMVEITKGAPLNVTVQQLIPSAGVGLVPATTTLAPGVGST